MQKKKVEKRKRKQSRSIQLKMEHLSVPLSPVTWRKHKRKDKKNYSHLLRIIIREKFVYTKQPRTERTSKIDPNPHTHIHTHQREKKKRNSPALKNYFFGLGKPKSFFIFYFIFCQIHNQRVFYQNRQTTNFKFKLLYIISTCVVYRLYAHLPFGWTMFDSV